MAIRKSLEFGGFREKIRSFSFGSRIHSGRHKIDLYHELRRPQKIHPKGWILFYAIFAISLAT